MYHRHFPVGCPPADARSADNVTVYRFWGSDPPPEADRKTFYEQDPDKFRTSCEARGLSVFLSRPDAREAQRAVRSLRKKPILVEATVPPEAGVIKRTFDLKGHHTLWLEAQHHDDFETWCTRVT